MKNSRTMFDLTYLLKDINADDIDRINEKNEDYHCCYSGSSTRITSKTQYFRYFNYGQFDKIDS